MGIKKTFLLKKQQHSFIPFVQPKLAQMNSGYFSRLRITRHSFPDPLNFSRWQLSQISHPGDRCGCQNPNPRALYEV